MLKRFTSFIFIVRTIAKIVAFGSSYRVRIPS
jgi:hypothetical protein